MCGFEPGTLNACANFLLSDAAIPSPCFVIDALKLRENCSMLGKISDATGARILLALKAYACWPTFRMLSKTGEGQLAGVCASSVDEARLGQSEFGGEVHAFSAAWSRDEIEEIAEYADYLVFNSLAQWRALRRIVERLGARREKGPIKCGLRINPEHSEGAVAMYNPCAPGSRLGIRASELEKADAGDLAGISGLHFHTLCEQNSDALARTLAAVESKFGKYLKAMEWLNWGGGHHITRADYDRDLLATLIRQWNTRYGCQIYLEPGEAVALDAGWLLATVLDVVCADMPIAILDVSAACHMPDVLEMPYRPEVWIRQNGTLRQAGRAAEKRWTCRLAGKSCLAGDIIGEYSFDLPLNPGDRLAFADMAIYSMVKTTTFNGLRLPSIAIHDAEAKPEFQILRNFCYEDFRNRLA